MRYTFTVPSEVGAGGGGKGEVRWGGGEVGREGREEEEDKGPFTQFPMMGW